MSPPSLAGSLLLLGQLALQAQAAETVWSSFVYLYHGETRPRPLSDGGWPSLTSLGAQQLYRQGEMLRARYLGNETLHGAGGTIVTAPSPLAGLAPRALDNTQLSIYSTNADYDVASALAFMQGLYPPAAGAFSDEAGGVNAATLANGTLVNYPLDGYQYPTVQAKGIYDGELYQIQGQLYCSELVRSHVLAGQDETLEELRSQGPRLYSELEASVLGDQATFPASAELSALDLWEYAHFEYVHNATVAAQLPRDLLDELQALAGVQQVNYYGNLTASGRRRGDRIRAVAGRTLAARAVGELRRFLAGAASQKLSVVVGSFEPLLSFFALARLIGTGRPSDATFDKLPAPGAAMVIELFSNNNDVETDGLIGIETDDEDDPSDNGKAGTRDGPPAGDALWVRFLYRDGAAADAGLYEYPILGRGHTETALRWSDFAAGIEAFALPDLRSWCRTCDALTPPCLAYAGALAGSRDGGRTGHERDDDDNARRPSPALAGVIGSLVTLAVLGLATTAAVCLGGLRLHRRGRGGGFKGPEKMASDRDLTLGPLGPGHERIGSWEMAGKPVSTRSLMPAAGPAVAAPAGPPPPAYPSPKMAGGGGGGGAGSSSSSRTVAGAADDKSSMFGATVVRQVDADDDDGVSILSEAPVKPRETV